MKKIEVHRKSDCFRSETFHMSLRQAVSHSRVLRLEASQIMELHEYMQVTRVALGCNSP